MTDWLVPLSDVRFTDGEVEAVAEVYRSGWLSQGPRVAAFERDFAAFTGSGHALAVSSATAALHLSLVASGVAAGDEVIVPSLTFAATADTVIAAGARPVFADVRALDRPWLATEAVEAAIGPRTRAIITVGYGGHPGEAQRLRALADARGLLLVEDAAHALGAVVGGRAAGTIGHAGAFSFFANKNLHLGEGGMLVTDDPDLLQRARLLRSHGLSTDTWARHLGADADYDVVLPGFNYRLDEPRAALGRLLLARLPEDNRRRADLAATYGRALSSLPAVAPAITTADRMVSCAWHIYPVVLGAGLNRPDFRARLRAAGVQTGIHYPPLHRTSAFAGLASSPLPVTDDYGRRTVTLPLFAHMTGEQQGRVISAVESAARP